VLYQIDPRPYQAALNQAKAKVAQVKAQLTYDEAEYQRNLSLARTGGRVPVGPRQEPVHPGVDLANIAADKAAVVSRQSNRWGFGDS
jgi:multidrug resistance efflux pump